MEDSHVIPRLPVNRMEPNEMLLPAVTEDTLLQPSTLDGQAEKPTASTGVNENVGSLPYSPQESATRSEDSSDTTSIEVEVQNALSSTTSTSRSHTDSSRIGVEKVDGGTTPFVVPPSRHSSYSCRPNAHFEQDPCSPTTVLSTNPNLTPRCRPLARTSPVATHGMARSYSVSCLSSRAARPISSLSDGEEVVAMEDEKHRTTRDSTPITLHYKSQERSLVDGRNRSLPRPKKVTMISPSHTVSPKRSGLTWRRRRQHTDVTCLITSAERQRSPSTTSRDTGSVREPDSRSTSPGNIKKSGSPCTLTKVAFEKEFSMDQYRALHQREFYSLHEELSFLRGDFVSSRKTLGILNEEVGRLKKALRDKADEVDGLRDKLDQFRRVMHRHTKTGEPTSDSGVGIVKTLGYYASPSDDERSANEQLNADSEMQHNDTASLVTGARPASSALWLYAASRVGSDTRALRMRNEAGKANDYNTVQLINELRCNLARRDTALDELRMQCAANEHARDALEIDLRRYKKELQEAMHHSNDVNRKLEEKQVEIAKLEEQLREEQSVTSMQSQELEALRKRLHVDNLLRGTPQMDSDGAVVVSPFPAVDGREIDYLQEQLQLYRCKWQAAEDQVDHLRQRLRDPACGNAGGLGLAAGHDGAPMMASPGLNETRQQKRYEEELRTQLDEISRLQRRLEREHESAAFHAEQQRQQRLDEARHHRAEVNALQEQLRATKADAQHAHEEKELLTRQLRQTTHSEALSDVLQTSNDNLKQRLSELKGELGQIVAREKEVQRSAQHEMSERLRLEHANEALQASLLQGKKQEALLTDEISHLRQRVGMEEGRVFALEQVLAQRWPEQFSLLGHSRGQKTDATTSTSASDSSKVKDEGDNVSTTRPSHLLPWERDGNADAVASQMKGYMGLLELNTAMRDRMKALEGEVDEAKQQLAQMQHVGRDAEICPNNVSESMDTGSNRGLLVRQLREEVQWLRLLHEEAEHRLTLIMKECSVWSEMTIDLPVAYKLARRKEVNSALSEFVGSDRATLHCADTGETPRSSDRHASILRDRLEEARKLDQQGGVKHQETDAPQASSHQYTPLQPPELAYQEDGTPAIETIKTLQLALRRAQEEIEALHKALHYSREEVSEYEQLIIHLDGKDSKLTPALPFLSLSQCAPMQHSARRTSSPVGKSKRSTAASSGIDEISYDEVAPANGIPGSCFNTPSVSARHGAEMINKGKSSCTTSVSSHCGVTPLTSVRTQHENNTSQTQPTCSVLLALDHSGERALREEANCLDEERRQLREELHLMKLDRDYWRLHAVIGLNR